MVDADLAPKDAGTWTVLLPKLLQPKRLKKCFVYESTKTFMKKLEIQSQEKN